MKLFKIEGAAIIQSDIVGMLKKFIEEIEKNQVYEIETIITSNIGGNCKCVIQDLKPIDIGS